MAFQNGQTRSQIEALTTGARVTENEFREGLGSIIEKADVAPRSLTVNGELATSDANDNWSVTIESEDSRLVPPPGGDTGALELTLVDGEPIWQPRVPFGDFTFPEINGQSLFTVGDPVRDEGRVLPRLIPNPRFSGSTTNTAGGGSGIFQVTYQGGAFALSATAQTLPAFEGGWINGEAHAAGNFGSYIMNPASTFRASRGGNLGVALAAPLNDLVQNLSNGNVSASIGRGRISRSGASSVTITLTGLTSSFVSSYPIIGVYAQQAPYTSGVNGFGVWVNLTDYSIHGGTGRPAAPSFGGLTTNNGASNGSGDGGNPGVIINDVSVPAVRRPLMLNMEALRDASAPPTGDTLPSTVPTQVGRIFILTGTDGSNTPGIYYSDGTNWVGS